MRRSAVIACSTDTATWGPREFRTRVETGGMLRCVQQYLKKERCLTVGGFGVHEMDDDAGETQFS